MSLVYKLKLQIFTVIVCVSLLGCGQIDKAQLYGVYEANFDEGVERITLLQDNTYTQEIQLKSGASYFNKGSWSFSKIDKTILFNQVMSIDLTDWNKIGFAADKTDHQVSIGTFGVITLNFDDDLGIYYKKIH